VRGIYTGVDHARKTGDVAGANMSGGSELYSHIPVNQVEAPESSIHLSFVGNCSSGFETHGFWWKVASTSSSSPSSSSSSSSSSSKRSTKSAAEDRKQEQLQKDSTSLSDRLFNAIGLSKENKQGAGSSSSSSRTMIVRGKDGMRKLKPSSSSNSGTNNNSIIIGTPPLGLGVVFYVNNDTIVGVLISGVKPSTNVDPSVLSYSIAINDFARNAIGMNVRDMALSIAAASYAANNAALVSHNGKKTDDEEEKEYVEAEAEVDDPLFPKVEEDNEEQAEIDEAQQQQQSRPPTEAELAAFGGERLVKLHVMFELAANIIAPAVAVASPSAPPAALNLDVKNTKTANANANSNATIPKPLYRFSASTKAVLRELTEGSKSNTPGPVVANEKVAQVSINSGTLKDKISAAYTRGIRGN